MRTLIFLAGLLFTGLNHSFAQDGYSLFFTDQYQNPAISSHLESHYVDVQMKNDWSEDLSFDHYSLGATANAAFNNKNSNIGLMYYHHDFPYDLRSNLSLNLGHYFNLTDSTRLSVGLNATWGQQKDRFPNLNEVDFVAPPSQSMLNPPKTSVFTENLGIWYQSPNYYAGLSVRNFLIASEGKALLEELPWGTDYPLGVNGVIARHFSLGDVRLSPTVQYRGVGAYSMSHWFWPGIVTQIHDKYTFGFKARPSHDTPVFNYYRVQTGAEFWDKLLIRAQAGFRTFDHSKDFRVGAGVSWFIGAG